MYSRATTKFLITIGALAVLALAAWTSSSGASPKAHPAAQCSSSDNGPRNPANPLDTANFTGTDPLAGAHLFVESPWQYGGDAADAIADEVGLGSLSHKQSGTPIPWAQFEQRVNSMDLPERTAFKVNQLEKIGSYPQAHQFSLYTAGGSGSAIFTQVQNYLCRMQRTDPQAAAVLTTYFIKHVGCNSGSQPNFQAEVQAVKAAVGNFPALIYVEEDAIDTICWRSPSAVTGRAALLKYEIDQLSQLPARAAVCRGRDLGRELPEPGGPGAQRRRRVEDPRLLHERHPFQLGLQGDPVREQGLGADPRPALPDRHSR